MADGILWQLAQGIGKDWSPQFNQGVQMGEAREQKNNRRNILQSLTTGPDGNLDVKSGVTQLIKAGDPEGALQIGQLYKAFQPETTDEIKEYNLDRTQRASQGLPPRSFFDFKAELKKAGATRINNSIQTGDNQYAKTIGENDAKGYIDINKAGVNAQSKLNSINLMDNLTRDPNFYSGFGGEMRLKTNRALSSLGITDANAAAPTEVFDAIAKKFVLDIAGGSLGTGFSNADRDFIQGQVAGLQNTPDGNRQLLSIQRAVAQREAQIAQMARQFAAQNKGRFDQAAFNEQIARWSEQNPVFPQARQPQGNQQQAQPQQRAAPPAPTVGQVIKGYRYIGGNPADQNSWEKAQ